MLLNTIFRLPNGNVHRSTITAIPEWWEVYDSAGNYEGIVLPCKSVGLSGSQYPDYVIATVPTDQFKQMVKSLKLVYPQVGRDACPDYDLNLVPYTKDPIVWQFEFADKSFQTGSIFVFQFDTTRFYARDYFLISFRRLILPDCGKIINVPALDTWHPPFNMFLKRIECCPMSLT